MKIVSLPNRTVGVDKPSAWPAWAKQRLYKLAAQILLDHDYSHVHEKIFDMNRASRHAIYISLIDLCLEKIDIAYKLIPSKTKKIITMARDNIALKHNKKVVSKIAANYRYYLKKCFLQDAAYNYWDIFNPLFDTIFRYSPAEFTALAKDVLDIAFKHKVKTTFVWLQTWLCSFEFYKNDLLVDDIFSRALELWQDSVHDMMGDYFSDVRTRFVEFIFNLAKDREDLIQEIVLYACRAADCPPAAALLHYIDSIMMSICNPTLLECIIRNKTALQKAILAVCSQKQEDIDVVLSNKGNILMCMAMCEPTKADYDFWRALLPHAKRDISAWIVYASAVPEFFSVIEAHGSRVFQSKLIWPQSFVDAVTLMYSWPSKLLNASMLPPLAVRKSRVEQIKNFVNSASLLSAAEYKAGVDKINQRIKFME